MKDFESLAYYIPGILNDINWHDMREIDSTIKLNLEKSLRIMNRFLKNHNSKKQNNSDIPSIVGFVWFIEKRGLTFSYFTDKKPSLNIENKAHKANKKIMKFLNERKVVVEKISCNGENYGLISFFKKMDVKGYCSMIFKGSQGNPFIFEDQKHVNLRALTNALYLVMVRRAKIFSQLPAKISKEYWDNSHFKDEFSLPQSHTKLMPPWHENDQLRLTVTLSADLRLSTFCMDNARSFVDYSRWNNELVQILIDIAHFHGGVFDKFTGDGALIHFLDDESDKIYNTSSVIQALTCARDINYALNRHVDRLRKNLHHDNKYLGVGIGLDIGDAHWSMSEHNAPIVVGDGVVGACRCCDLSKPHNIIMTNYFYSQALKYTDKMNFAFTSCTKECDYTSKEHLKDAGVKARKYKPQRLSSNETYRIHKILKRIYQQSE